MNDTKLWWQSKTIWGAIITTVSLVLYLLGVAPMVSGEETSRIADIVLLVSGSGGLLTTIIGRLTAVKQVALSAPTE